MNSFVLWLSQSWGILVAIITGATLIWNFFNKTLKEIKTDINKPFSDMTTKLDNLEEKIDTKDKLTTGALLTLQRKSILDSCEKYIALGFANLHQKEVLMAQFESYKALGGNSFVHELVDQVQNLPIERKERVTLNE